MSSIVFKACVRCTGEMYLEEDSDGQYLTCLRCGHVTYPQTELEQLVGFLSDRAGRWGCFAARIGSPELTTKA